jgi:hypothetical protein
MSSSSVATNKAAARERMPRSEKPIDAAATTITPTTTTATTTATEDAQATVQTLNGRHADKEHSNKKTYGRTPEGKGTYCTQGSRVGYGMADTKATQYLWCRKLTTWLHNSSPQPNPKTCQTWSF